MIRTAIIRTGNPSWGFWGACRCGAFDQQAAWLAVCDALMTAFDLSEEQVRDLLDARFGRWLADDLSFVPGGPTSYQVIERHIMARLADSRWRGWFATAVTEARAAGGSERTVRLTVSKANSRGETAKKNEATSAYADRRNP